MPIPIEVENVRLGINATHRIGLFRQALLTPWKVRNEVIRYWTLPRARLLFAWTGIAWGTGWKLYGVPIVQRHQASVIHIGDRLALRSTVGTSFCFTFWKSRDAIS